MLLIVFLWIDKYNNQLIPLSLMHFGTLLFLCLLESVSLSPKLTQCFGPPTMDLFTNALQSECI